MEDLTEKISEWARAVQKKEAIVWDRLPDIDLYMDQVLTYMDKQLELFQCGEENKLLTSNMINNYVKDGIIPRPKKKKYSREHLAIMLNVFMLKQVLSMQNIASLIKNLPESEELFDMFTISQDKALKEVCDRVLKVQATPEGMRQLTLELSIEANARRVASESILAMLAEQEKQAQKNEKNEKQKKVTE